MVNWSLKLLYNGYNAFVQILTPTDWHTGTDTCNAYMFIGLIDKKDNVFGV